MAESERYDWYEIDFSLKDGLGLDDALELCEELDEHPKVLAATLSGGNDGHGHPFTAKAVERAAQAMYAAQDNISIERVRELLPVALAALYTRSAV